MSFKENLKNGIASEPFGVRNSNFQDFLVFMTSITGESFK